MSAILSPGELAKGQYVTVLEWRREDHMMDSIMGQPVVITEQSHNFCGDVLEIKAVQLPYVLVAVGALSVPIIKLDTRRLTLMECSSDYVEAVLGKRSPQGD